MSSPNTERNDVIQSRVIPDYQIQSKQENAKYKLKYITSHPFATNWSFEQIVDFENKGQPISMNGRVYYPDSYKNTTTVSQDNKSEQQHKQGQQRAKQERQRQEENKQQDFLNDFTNETIGWVPGVNTFVRAGLSQWANRTNNPRAAEYDINAALGLVGDAAMFAFGGVKPLELATAYTGSKVGKHYGGTVGEIAGAMVGGKAGSNLQQAIQDIRILNNTRRFAKRLDEVVNSTPFYNQNVQHVSPNGMTIGSHLTPYNSTDVGIHVVTPNETKAVANIQRASDIPTTVREGVLTYTQNTAPINYGNDLGLWGSNVNPGLYSHFQWNYPFKLDNPRMQDAITLGENAPIGEYVNTWEGEGQKALMITDPNYLQLSKNLIIPKVPLIRAQSILHPKNDEGRVLYTNGQLMAEAASPINYDTKTFGGVSYKLQGPLYDKAVKPFVEDVKEMYNSDWYLNRLRKHNFSPEQIREALSKLNSNINKTNYFITEDALPRDWIGGSGTDIETGEHAVALNGKFSDHPAYNTIIHELGHTSTTNIPSINKVNRIISELAKKYINPKTLTQDEAETLNYFLNIYNEDGSTELEGQVRNALLSMYKNNYTPEEYLNSQDFQNDIDLQKVVNIIGPENIKTILSYALAMSPFIIKNNDK